MLARVRDAWSLLRGRGAYLAPGCYQIPGTIRVIDCRWESNPHRGFRIK